LIVDLFEHIVLKISLVARLCFDLQLLKLSTLLTRWTLYRVVISYYPDRLSIIEIDDLIGISGESMLIGCEKILRMITTLAKDEWAAISDCEELVGSFAIHDQKSICSMELGSDGSPCTHEIRTLLIEMLSDDL